MAIKDPDRDDRVTVVPIKIADDAEKRLDGEDLYRQQGDVVIEEAEVISERPLYEDSDTTDLSVKPSDVQQADYQVEHPPVAYGDDEDVFGVLNRPEAPPRPPRKRSAVKKRPPSFSAFVSKYKIALIAVAAVLALSAAYAGFSAAYTKRIHALKYEVSQIYAYLESGSGDEEADLTDEVAFYMDLSARADAAEADYRTLNKTYWFLLFKPGRSSVGLEALSDKLGEIEPYLKRIDPLLNQIDEVFSVVVGDAQNPGHLLSYLDFGTAQDTLDGDRTLIAAALEVCDELNDLPASFASGMANQKTRLSDLDDAVLLLERYLNECAPIAEEIQAFNADAKAWYDGYAFTGTLGTDLYAQVRIIQAGDGINEEIAYLNSQPRYKAMMLYYNMASLGMDDYGQRMFDEKEAVNAAYAIAYAVYDEETNTLAPARNNGTEKTAYAQVQTNNAAYIASLPAISLPSAYAAGLASYTAALNTRAQYLAKYLDAVASREEAASFSEEIAELEAKLDALEQEYRDTLDGHGTRSPHEIMSEYNDTQDALEEAKENHDRALNDYQKKQNEASALYALYIDAVQINKN